MMKLIDITTRQLIMFDLDGTLVDTAPDLYRSMNLALQQLDRPPITAEQVAIWVGKGTEMFCRHVLTAQDGDVNAFELAKLLSCFLEVYQNNVCVDSRIFPGIVEFLDYCKTQQKILVCVTNKPYAPAAALLEKIQLSDYFSLLIGGDSLAKRKPDPLPLLHVLAEYQIDVSDSLMVGDSVNDVEAARAAQVDCIALSYGYNHGEDIRLCSPQWVVDSLLECIPEK